jgi:hypothetical protein
MEIRGRGKQNHFIIFRVKIHQEKYKSLENNLRNSVGNKKLLSFMLRMKILLSDFKLFILIYICQKE